MMNLNESVINVIFDAGRGSVSVQSREAVRGTPFGKLPTPTRKGYGFGGWYLNGELVTEETIVTAEDDIRLVARWSKIRAMTQRQDLSSYKRQRIIAFALALLALRLIAIWILLEVATTIHKIEDKWIVDGVEYTETYYIRAEDGVYALYDADDNRMPINELSTHNIGDNSDIPYVVYIAKTSGNQYLIDTSTGDYEPYAVVDYGDGEVLGFRDRVLMYPQIAADDVFSVEVKNEHGTYKMYRDKYGNVKLAGFEKSTVTLDYSQFINLCDACGYTITLQKLDMSPQSDVARLPDGVSVDYAAYGLTDVYEDGKLVYSPTVFTIVAANREAATGYYSEGETRYTVKVGYPILSKSGYYMQLEGRDTIYIGDTVVEESVLQPIESMVVPIVVHSTNTSNYLMIENFQLGTISGSLWDFDPEKPEQGGKPIVGFTYQDLDERMSTMYTVSPYLSTLEMMNGYTLHDNNVTNMLGLLYQMQSNGCVKLGLDKASLAEYGLDNNIYYLMYDSPAVDDNGNQIESYKNYLLISQKTERNTYYVATFVSDMIVEIDAAYLSFLEWPVNSWYHEYFFQHNVSYIPKLDIQIGDKVYNFTTNNLLSYGYYENAKGRITRVNLENGSVRQDSEGRWIFTDESGTSHTLRVFDFRQGDLFIKLEADDNTVIYKQYYKYLITRDRNNEGKLTIVTNDAGYEQIWSYNLGAYSATKGRYENYKYTLVYRDGAGEEFIVSGQYTDGNGNRYSSPYVLTYWQESKTTLPNGTTGYVWERKVRSNAATDINLRSADEKLYQIPVMGTNLQVFCQQATLDYTTVYQYKTDVGTVETATITGSDNFRDLYSKLLYYSLEGTIDRAEFEKLHGGMTVEQFIRQNNPHAIFTYTVSDLAGNMNIIAKPDEGATEGTPNITDNGEEKIWHENNEKDVVVRLYRYSPTRSILTISVDGSEGAAIFYVQSDYCDEIVEAAEKLLAQIPIKPEGEIVA